MHETDTIFAPSTAAGRAGIAVIRLSGPEAASALRVLTGGKALPEPRKARLSALLSADGARLDIGLMLWFPGPGSFTGEDMAELHIHGGRAVTAAVLQALADMPGLRPAEAGEFTRRAFDHDKLDLSAIEGLADLIAAETEAQRRQALRQLEGQLRDLIEGWRGRLLAALAHLEAAIDFSDDELPAGLIDQVFQEVRALGQEIAQHLAQNQASERLRDGFRVAILGPANAGKSSLLNALAKRDVAIVSELAGTTRDVIEVHLDLGGYPVILADTAGLRALQDDSGLAGDEIEREGMRRSQERAAAADLKLIVLDFGQWPALDETTQRLIDDDSLVLLNKVDLTDAPAAEDIADARCLAISAKTGAGLPALIGALEQRVAAALGVSTGQAALTRLRHRHALQEAQEALERSQAAAQLDLAAEDLRLAVRALGRITGRVDVEDLLDVIFSDFCIGK